MVTVPMTNVPTLALLLMAVPVVLLNASPWSWLFETTLNPLPALVIVGAVPPVAGRASLSVAGVMPDRVVSDAGAPCPITRWLFSNVSGAV